MLCLSVLILCGLFNVRREVIHTVPGTDRNEPTAAAVGVSSGSKIISDTSIAVSFSGYLQNYSSSTVVTPPAFETHINALLQRILCVCCGGCYSYHNVVAATTAVRCALDPRHHDHVTPHSRQRMRTRSPCPNSTTDRQSFPTSLFVVPHTWIKRILKYVI